jgi:hypothetical protein
LSVKLAFSGEGKGRAAMAEAVLRVLSYKQRMWGSQRKQFLRSGAQEGAHMGAEAGWKEQPAVCMLPTWPESMVGSASWV